MDVVLFLQLQVVARLDGVEHALVSSIIVDHSLVHELLRLFVRVIIIVGIPCFLGGAEAGDVHSRFVEEYKVIVFIFEEESYAVRFPQLESLMPENNRVVVLLGDVNAENVVGVNVNVFETQDELLVTVCLIGKHIH